MHIHISELDSGFRRNPVLENGHAPYVLSSCYSISNKPNPAMTHFLHSSCLLICLHLFLACALLAPSPSLAVESGAQPGNAPLQATIKLTPEEKAFLKTNPVIRVGNEDDWPPFDFSERGQPKGYAIEHLELLGSRLGISFEYINGYTWAELLELFRQGEIDLLPSLWYSDSRAEYMLFTEPFLVLPYVIITNTGNTDIQDFSDLSGKTVSVARGYVQESVLREHYPDINLYQVDNVLEGLKAVSYGQADAYIGYHGSVSYLIATNFLYDLKIVGETGVPELGPQGLYISTRKDMKPLRDILQKAMDSLPEDEKIRLRKKWIAVDQTSRPSFTAEERRFLRDNPVLNVDNMQYWAPFNFREDGKARGFAIEYMNILARKMGVTFNYVSGPTWKEFMTMLQKGDIDILCDVVQTPQREKNIAFTGPYFELITGIVVPVAERGEYSGITDLVGKDVAVPQNFYFQEILAARFPEINVVAFENSLACLKAVSSGKVDAALSEKPVFDYLINKYFLFDLTSIPITDAVELENTPVSLGVQKDRTILRDILQKSMDTIDGEEVDTLRERWLRLSENQDQSRIVLNAKERDYLHSREAVSLCVHPEWMPFERFTADGRYTGMIAGIMALLEHKSGLRFTAEQSDSWRQSIEMFTNGKCDILTSAQNADHDAVEMLLTKPYLESFTVIVSRNEHPFIADMSTLAGNSLGLLRDDPVREYISGNYPELDIRVYDTPDRMLEDVNQGKVDLGLGNLHLLSSKIHALGLYNLKIAGQTPYKDYFKLGIRADDPVLKNILNKAITSLTPQEVDRVVRNWIAIRYDQGIDYTLVWQIALGSLFLISLFVYWNRKLSRLNNRIAEAQQDLERKNLELERLSITDSLTNVFNRMKIDAVLEDEIQRADRSGEPLSLILLDIDKFKEVNDTYGHLIGDKVLIKVADLLHTHIRKVDSMGRWGGEEFIIICPFTTCEGAWQLAEKLRLKIMSANFPEVGRITASFGVSEYVRGENLDDLLKRTDEAMYKAKDTSRNRTEMCKG
jgi:diguanylate cyclase (GGDEF)-like protein